MKKEEPDLPWNVGDTLTFLPWNVGDTLTFLPWEELESALKRSFGLITDMDELPGTTGIITQIVRRTPNITSSSEYHLRVRSNKNGCEYNYPEFAFVEWTGGMDINEDSLKERWL